MPAQITKLKKAKSWQNWKSEVLKRDNHTCQECGATGKLIAHHIKSTQEYPQLNLDITNGITLCQDCYQQQRASKISTTLKKHFNNEYPLPTQHELEELYLGKKYSLRMIAVEFHTNHKYISEKLREYSIPMRTRSEARKVAAKYHGGFVPGKGAGAIHWRGGKWKNNEGYIFVYAPDHPRARKNSPHIREHILVWEQTHNKPLPKGWIVHHLNGIKDDNRPENLVAMPSKKHDNLLPILQEKIRILEVKNKQLKRALEANQMIFYVN